MSTDAAQPLSEPFVVTPVDGGYFVACEQFGVVMTREALFESTRRFAEAVSAALRTPAVGAVAQETRTID